MYADLSQRVNVETRSYDSQITDSAAASTALATGVRTNNGRVGVDPDDMELTTLVDIAASLGKRTGILTTGVLYGATPMGFSGHGLSRKEWLPLVQSASVSSNVNLFASYLLEEDYHEALKNGGYEKIPFAGDISTSTTDKIYGTYRIKSSAPSMTADQEVAFDYLVAEALNYLSQDEDGFFLMAEGAGIDHGGHNNDFVYMLNELLAFDDAVSAVLKWASTREDTVVIVTADHETGDLSLHEDMTKENMFDMDENNQPLYYAWGRDWHSSTDMYCYVDGVDIDFSKYSFSSNNRIKNTDIFKIIKALMIGG